MIYDIVTIGDALEDVFVEPELRIKRDPTCLSGRAMSVEFGEKVPLSSVNFEIGGSACNAAVGFRRLGFKTSIIAMLGKDEPADKVVARLRKEKVATDNLIVRKELQTGYSVIFLVDGERTIFVFHGPKDYKMVRVPEALETEWFYLAPLGHDTDELLQNVVSSVAERGAKVAWNPGSIQIGQGARHFKYLLKCTKVLFLNKEEAVRFVNLPVKPEIRELMKMLHSLGPEIVVITNGKEGARAYDGKNFYESEANTRVQKVDVTGAGDSFSVGFLANIISCGDKDFDINQALKWGIWNSSSVIQYVGAQRGLLRRNEIESRS